MHLLRWLVLSLLLSPSSSLTLRLVHRLSEEVRQRYGGRYDAGPLRSPPFYSTLFRFDSARHSRRRLLGDYRTLHFAAGNETKNYGEQFGWLHFAVLDIGTPNVSFLVALDTGSDLLWVPCECKQCASTSLLTLGLDQKLNVYDPSASNSSKHVTCGNDLCVSGNKCKSKTADCPYNVNYLSDNTSTSGILVEDVIYFAAAGNQDTVKTPVVFGCGQVQSGGFLDGGAPDGLLGLGLADISVPNFLAKAGLVKNSFSMCFQDDGSGRIFFGDKGARGQQTTPLLPINHTYIVYMVAVQHISIGGTLVTSPKMEMLVDTGTSFTYFPAQVYAAIATKFDQQVKQARIEVSNVPWQFCYEATSTEQNNVEVPSMSIVFHGGGKFTIYSPIIGIYNENSTLEAFCLGILQSDIAILGQNFMIGYRLVFDGEEKALGWSPSNCYNLEEEEASKEDDAVAPSPGVATPEEANSPVLVKHPVSPAMSVPLQGISNSSPSTQPNAAAALTFSASMLSLLMFLLRFFIS